MEISQVCKVFSFTCWSFSCFQSASSKVSSLLFLEQGVPKRGMGGGDRHLGKKFLKNLFYIEEHPIAIGPSQTPVVALSIYPPLPPQSPGLIVSLSRKHCNPKLADPKSWRNERLGGVIAFFRDTPLGHIRCTWSEDQMAINGHFGHIWPFMAIWPSDHVRQIWPYGVSLKRAIKM